jgi:hypothetical protein
MPRNTEFNESQFWNELASLIRKSPVRMQDNDAINIVMELQKRLEMDTAHNTATPFGAQLRLCLENWMVRKAGDHEYEQSQQEWYNRVHEKS